VKVIAWRVFRPFAALGACLTWMTAGGCGSSAPLFRSMTPAMDAFVSAEIPLQFEQGYPFLVLRSGMDSMEVFLDTGAGQVGVGLPPETVRSLRLEESGRTRTLKTNAGSIRYKQAVLREARFGGIVFRDVVCDQVMPPAGSESPGRGIMGLALLRRFNVLFDYGDSRLVLLKAGRFPADFESSEWRRIPFTDDPDGMMIPGRPEGISGDLKWCLDTGAIARNPEGTEYYNLMKPKHFRGWAGAAEKDGRLFFRGHAFLSGGIRIDSLNFLGHDFGEPGGVNGFLGADFFMKNRVLADFANQALWIQPSRTGENP
jgi:hypothetical protein